MGKRLRWIAVTYLTNKTFLVALVLASLWLGGIWWTALTRTQSYQTNFLPRPSGRLTVNNKESLDEVRRLKMQTDVDAIDLGQLWRSMERAEQEPLSKQPGFRYSTSPPPESFFDVLNEFPNLRIVHVNFDDPTTGVQRVSRLRKITYLSVDGVGLHDVAPFQSLENLERLDLNVYQPVTHLSSLAVLPRLQTLLMGNRQAVTDGVLAELTSLPFLQTLVLQFITPDVRQPLSDAALAGLAKCRSLKTIYAGNEKMPRQVDLLAQTRAALPGFTVRPAFIIPRPPLFVYLIPCMLAMAVGTVLASQFKSHASRLTANFAASHAIVAAIWMVAIGIPTACCMWVSGIPAIGSLIVTLVMLAWTLAGGVEFFIKRRFGSATPTKALKDWFFALTSFGLIVMLFSTTVAETIRDSNPGMLAILGCLSLVIFGLVARTLRDLAQDTLGDFVASRSSQARLPYRQGWLFASNEREHTIQSWRQVPPHWTWWKRIERWRAGNPPIRSFRFAIYFLGGAVLAAAAFRWLIPEARNAFGPDQFRGQLVLLPIILLWMVSAQIASVWRKRLQSLDTESLRPIVRRKLQQEWAAALALDLAPIAILVALIEAIGVNFMFDLRETWPALNSVVMNWQQVTRDFVVLGLFTLTFSVAVSGVLIVIERNWLRILSAFALFMFSALGVGVLASLLEAYPRSFLSEPRFIVAQLWWPVIVATAAIAGMWKLWTRIEFDRRG